MPTESAPSRKWVGPALRAGRVAAFLTLATGVNGAIATFAPRYEPIYVYLVSIAIVAWLGSMLLGITAAVAAVVVYDFMFAPVRGVPTVSAVVPLAIAIAVAVATRMVRAPVMRARTELPVSAPPPLLPPAEAAPPIDVEKTADRSAEIEDLEQRLHASMATAERESRLGAEAAAATRFRLAALQREVDEARDQVLQQVNRVADLRAEADAAKRQKDESKAESEKALVALQHELQEARRKAEEETQRADRETAFREEQATAASQSLHKAIAEVATKYQTPLSQAKKRLEDAFTRIPQLEKEIAAEKARSTKLEETAREAAARAESVELRLAKFTKQLESVRAEGAGERRRADEATVQRKEIEQALRAATSKAESSESRVADLSAEVETLRAEVAAERIRADRETLLREQLEVAGHEKLQNAVGGVSTKYDSALAEAREHIARLERDVASTRDDARATLESASEQIARLQNELAAARKSADEVFVHREAIVREKLQFASQQKIQTLTAETAAKYEKELEESRTALESATMRLEIEKSQRQRETLGFDEKLERIVGQLTKDFEESLGEAMVEKQSAKAEIRTLTSRLQEQQRRVQDVDKLQASVERATTEMRRQLDAARQQAAEERALRERLDVEWNEKLQHVAANAATDHETAELRRQLEEARQHAAEEKAAREKLDVEWNAKLQRIVSNIAIDHEHDLGEALLEREAAKAELRSLTGRLHQIQQRFEQEREKWNQERARLTAVHPSGPTVLVVLSDAGARSMSKQVLEQSGYVVITAADGLEGLRMAASHKPAVVVAQAVMPKMNGRELVQLLKSRTETAGVKIVLVGATSGGETDRGTEFRADDFLASVADINLMRSTLANLLSGSRSS